MSPPTSKSVVAFTLLVASCGQPAKAGSKLVLKDYYSIAVPEGASIRSDCSTYHMPMAQLPENVKCIEYSYSENDDASLEWQIIQQLTDQGWAWGDGAANMLWVTRPVSDGCEERMNVIALIDGPETEVSRWGREGEGDMDWSQITAVILLAPEQVGTCE